MLQYEVMIQTRLWRMKENVKEAVHNFFTDEKGDTNMISIVIILVIVIGLAAIFRDNIVRMVTNMWQSITDDVSNSQLESSPKSGGN